MIDTLVTDLQKYGRGTWHDETQWLDVGLHACKQLNARRQVIFLTAFELSYAADLVPGADHGVALSQLRTGQGMPRVLSDAMVSSSPDAHLTLATIPVQAAGRCSPSLS